MYYSGIGSRETPAIICDKMKMMAKILASRGHVLRSGSAAGADKAFEDGHLLKNENLQCFVPWKKFVLEFKSYHTIVDNAEIVAQAERIASSIHPAWDRCLSGAKLLHTRNVYQVLGADLKTPSGFVICWTQGGNDTGGTRTAIVLAKQNDIPVFNLYGLEDASPLEILKHIAKNISEKL